MAKVGKRALTLILAVMMSIGLFSGCGSKGSQEDKPTSGGAEVTKQDDAQNSKKMTTIRIGTHSVTSDSEYIDPVTGKSPMKPDELEAHTKARDKVKKELNAEIKYVLYPGNVREVILKSVLANDPLCDVVGMTTGAEEVLIAQNVLQPLDDYAGLFSDEDVKWMYFDKMYGHNFLIITNMNFTSTWPLVYNITYLQKVDSLKENGKTILPTDLWKRGDWTWSKFEDYLTKVGTYYKNKKAPVRPEKTITAYTTPVIYPAINAIKANGGYIYNKNGLGVDSKETKEGIEYVYNLLSKKLITPLITNKGEGPTIFNNGETVFLDLQNWLLTEAGNALAQRGEAMGLVPFPRPDHFAQNDPRYKPFVSALGTMGIPKGISKDKTELAIKAVIMSRSNFFKIMAKSDKCMDYYGKEAGKEMAMTHGFDVTNEEYGNDVADAFMAYNPEGRANDFYNITQWRWQWEGVVNNSLLGLNGSPKYDIAIEAQKNVIKEQMAQIQSNVDSDKIVDNIPPTITLVGKGIAFAKGTDAKTIDWSKYIKAADNIDGDIDIKNVTIDTSKVKFDTAGLYVKGLVASVKDKEGNEKKAEMNIVVYDPENKTAPTLKIKESYRNIKLNEDTSKINWAKDFVDTATSVEGLDLKGNITADVSTLDITKAGKYDVTLTVTDYAGNKVEEKISVTVQ